MNLTNGLPEPKAFTSEELNLAFYHMEDILGRALCPFVLLGETAKSIKENYLKGNEITVGVRKAELTDVVLSTLKTLASPSYDLRLGMDNFEVNDQGVSWEYKGVPIRIKVIQRNYEFINNPDKVMYFGEVYNLPNPFDKYYNMRNLIK